MGSFEQCYIKGAVHNVKFLVRNRENGKFNFEMGIVWFSLLQLENIKFCNCVFF